MHDCYLSILALFQHLELHDLQLIEMCIIFLIEKIFCHIIFVVFLHFIPTIPAVDVIFSDNIWHYRELFLHNRLM